ncbi:MAG: GmrSD restriction endonuclease domain-containing protein [Rudaea sp.]
MKIELHEITIKKLTDGFEDNAEAGVIGYGGKLDIRPPYQREFIYKDKQRDAVIDTVRKNFPLNVMYWAVRENGGYEVIDGQQRTLSICQYVNGDFSINGLAFHNLKDDQQEQILNYKLMVYFCSGTDSEKLEWFKTINIAGEKLTDQELRNAVYAGPWTADAKRYFSKTGCPAYGLASDYMRGSTIRQEYLETAIDWNSNGKIEEYMSKHQHDKNATPLWQYFQKVIGWVKATFPNYRKEMKAVAWGSLYNDYKDEDVDTDKLEKQVARLMSDDDVTAKAGIYPFVLGGEERYLNIRAFTDNMKREAYERQKGACPKCKKKFELDQMEGDHIKPWHEGGKTNAANCQMLCKMDNRMKSGK